MGNWIPGDPTLVAQVLRISAAYTPPPPEGFVSPVTWGIETNVRERFGKAGIPAEDITCQPATYEFRYPGAAGDFLQIFRSYYGPTMNAFAAAEADGRAEDLHRELATLFEEQNKGGPGETVLAATFLKVVVNRPS